MDTEAVNRGFSKQSIGYDEADRNNIILQDLRKQVYQHVERFLSASSRMLELNAGTGIDAAYFTSRGHYVHATDISDGMIEQIQRKISTGRFGTRLTCQQLSFQHLHDVAIKDFDYVFSNMGGLNCLNDLAEVTRHLPRILKPDGYVTWVIMPPVCPWELMWLLKGKWKKAFRRLNKNGTLARVEGEYFTTFYHSLKQIREAFGDTFRMVKCEGLAALSPQPHQNHIPLNHPRLYKGLRVVDALFKDSFPFNRWADHLIVTFQYTP